MYRQHYQVIYLSEADFGRLDLYRSLPWPWESIRRTGARPCGAS
jgi:hypothetical protein